MGKRIEEYLLASKRCQRLVNMPLGKGRQLSIWENSHDEVAYHAAQGHTFSLYLKGGEGTYQVDGDHFEGGETGAVCIFPNGHSSTWRITKPFRFVHLYVGDEDLRGAFAISKDQDARRLDLSEQIQIRSEKFREPLQKMALAAMAGDHLAADVSFSDIIEALSESPMRLSGGLSLKARRDVLEWVHENIDQSIRLSDMAQISGLSDFHFHRMFQQSFGMAPHKWLVLYRTNLAKALLKTTPLSQVAFACGFSSQSHFTRQFKLWQGLTPGQYQKALLS